MNFNFSFYNSYVDSARLGFIQTPHGLIHTPAFFFCATKAALKSIDFSFIPLSKFNSAIVSNTYHLALFPNSAVHKVGLHKLMNWNFPILTDSGGYQIFSMGYGSVSSEIKGLRSRPSSLLKISEEKVLFRSYVNGQEFSLSPESSMQLQANLGADLIVQFDECTPYHFSYAQSKQAMLRSLRWADRSINAFKKYSTPYKQSLYGVVQGSVYPRLRGDSFSYLNKLKDIFGLAVGGSLGNSYSMMFRTLNSFSHLFLNCSKPLHLLGIGSIDALFDAVLLGFDTFDSVYPTRLARHGCAIVPGLSKYRLYINKKQYAHDYQTLDPLYNTIPHSRAYIHHLFKTREISALSLLSLHNFLQMLRLMKSIRSSLKKGKKDFLKLKNFWLNS